MRCAGAWDGSVSGYVADHGDALRWTAMLLTTIGSQYWPVMVKGCIPCFLLPLYPVSILGYLTAVLATSFAGQDAGNASAKIAGQHSVDRLRAEIAELGGGEGRGRLAPDPSRTASGPKRHNPAP